MESREVNVSPDKFEVTLEDVLLVTQLSSALAVCVYDAEQEAGALLHLRCIVRTAKPIDVTDSTLATELLLLDRCLAALRESAPTARHLQARIVVHLADAPQAAPMCETMVNLVKRYLEDGGVRLLPGRYRRRPVRSLRFRPSMGWCHTHLRVKEDATCARGPGTAAVRTALRDTGRRWITCASSSTPWRVRLRRRAVATTRRGHLPARQPGGFFHRSRPDAGVLPRGPAVSGHGSSPYPLPSGMPAARLLEQPLRDRGAQLRRPARGHAACCCAPRLSEQPLAAVEPAGDPHQHRPHQ
jgi:chemotaxis receptor (MCP) glutamine deamidase CheD